MAGFPEVVGAADLARLFGCTTRWVQKLTVQGVFKKDGRGKYLVIECIASWGQWRAESEQGSKKAEDPVEAERVRRMRRENDEAERLLMPVEDAVAAFDTIIGSLVSDLASVPARVTEDVVVRRKIEDEINGVLAEISERCARAAGDIQAGRDAAEADAADDTDGMGAEE
jgi:phage terminase Nu1 subunit (DNA packaging protein)